MSSPLSPISAAFSSALNVSALLAVAPGGVFDDVPTAPSFPFVLFDLNSKFTGGLGTRWTTPGANWQTDFRVHIFSQYQGWQEAQAVSAAVVALIEAGLTAPGFSVWATFNDTEDQFADQLIAGVKVKELVLSGRIYAEATAS